MEVEKSSEIIEPSPVKLSDIHKPAKAEKSSQRKKTRDQLSSAMDLFSSPKRQKLDGKVLLIIAGYNFFSQFPLVIIEKILTFLSIKPILTRFFRYK